MWADCWRVSGEVCTAEVSVGFTDIRTTSSEYKTGSTHVIWSVTMGGSVVEPNYIRSVSVCYRRCPSSVSGRSDVRAKSAVSSVSDAHRLERLLQHTDLLGCSAHAESRGYVEEKCCVLDEFSFLYGINTYKQFNFPRRSTEQMSKARTWIGNAWQCENEALRQMYNSASRFPRRRALLPTRLAPKQQTSLTS